ncbi:hypothetical protein AUC44_01165 [Deinococcus actinosclerus]|uniref:Uncharacterized protein n=1 Tax=Deinococcus actinosclerus TaxID=1768108 RepID=A0ABM5X1X6_9DEIO|nr:hypothetical protein AUC44_01165 [Deinococcus actinosclerus]
MAARHDLQPLPERIGQEHAGHPGLPIGAVRHAVTNAVRGERRQIGAAQARVTLPARHDLRRDAHGLLPAVRQAEPYATIAPQGFRFHAFRQPQERPEERAGLRLTPRRSLDLHVIQSSDE